MLHTRSNYLFYVITFFLFVLTTSCFSYIYWNPTLGGQILRCFDLIFIFLYFRNKRKIVNANFEREVNWIFKLAFLSVIGNIIFISSISDAKCYKYMFSCFYIILFFIAFLWNKRKDNYCNIDNFSFNDIVHSTSATIYISYSTFWN